MFTSEEMEERKKQNRFANFGCLGIFAVLVLIVVIGSLGSETTESAGNDAATATAPVKLTVDPEQPDPAPVAEIAEAESDLSFAQQQAVRSAMQYLNMSGFSREGLIRQLSSDAGEGFGISDATAAVDSLNVDWNEEAAQSAQQYIQMSGFSCQGLVQQLSSSAGEQFTLAQAQYGARQVGLC